MSSDTNEYQARCEILGENHPEKQLLSLELSLALRHEVRVAPDHNFHEASVSAARSNSDARAQVT